MKATVSFREAQPLADDAMHSHTDEDIIAERKRLVEAEKAVPMPDLSKLDPWERTSGFVLPNPCPYVSFRAPDGRPGIEIGFKGTF